jgi:prepilin-type N-terminal cleavage/methylation domain-containing protein
MYLIPRRIRDDERGLTLIELLLAVVLLGIIVVPLASALISFFHNTNATTNRLTESHDEQIAAAYFAQDVQSIGVRDWSGAPFALQTSVEQNIGPTAGLYPCGAASLPAATLRFAWNDPTGDTSTQVVIVSYVVETVAGAKQLHRVRCDSGSTTPTSDIVLAHELVSVGTPSFTGPSTTPQAVSWTLNIKAPSDTGAPLVVTLYGQRRQT